MVVFDTDIVSLVQQQAGPAFHAIDNRMRASEDDSFYTTIITFEEQMRGWLAVIAMARKPDRQLAGYARLHKLIEYFRDRPILPFDATAIASFQQLKTMKVRIGTMDLKIAAIALTNDALLVTRNLSDFRQIPNLRAEDWTRPL